MFLVSAQQMRQIDQYTIERLGIPEIVLMENAGRAVAEEVIKWSSERSEHSPPHTNPTRLSNHTKKWLVLAGKGNNGADGLVAARHLSEAGFYPTILYVTDPNQLEGSALLQKKMAENLQIPIIHYEAGMNIDWHAFDGIIDGLLGTGTKGAPREPMATIIREANASSLPIISIDIPSGIDADTGQLYEPSIQADMTVVLAMLKLGIVQYPARERCGLIRTRAIGIPLRLAEQFQVRSYYVNESFIREWIPEYFQPKNPNAHKGTFGHVALIAGTMQYSGAGILATRAAHRAGCGLVSWIVPHKLQLALIGVVPETILLSIEDQSSGDWRNTDPQQIVFACENKQAVVIGPGLGRFAEDNEWLKKIISNIHVPLILDADALNIIAEDPSLIELIRARYSADNKASTIITPHPGEMARLCGKTVAQVQQNRIQIASEYAQVNGTIVVLKGAATVIATPEGKIFVNSTGNAGMATGGTGDVLAGMIGSLLAQRYDAEKAAVLGVYLHGKAGDRAMQLRKCASSLIASDLIEHLL